MTPIIGVIASSKLKVTGAFNSIATASGNGVSTITFSSIPSTYKSLQIRFIGNNLNFDTLNLRFNADTGTNYAQHILQGNRSIASASGDASGAITGISIVSLSDATNMFSVGIIDIDSYASTVKNKTVRIFSGIDRSASGNISLRSGLWLNTAAITSVTLYTPSNCANNTTFALYGVN